MKTKASLADRAYVAAVTKANASARTASLDAYGVARSAFITAVSGNASNTDKATARDAFTATIAADKAAIAARYDAAITMADVEYAAAIAAGYGQIYS